MKFVNEGRNLYIYSKNNGNGKTQWSLKLLLKYFSSVWSNDSFTVRGLFINVARLCNAFKDNIDFNSEYLNHIKDNIYNADLIVWDDIGLKSLSPTEHDYIYSFVNARIESGKSNIFTSNLTKEDLKKYVGDRLYSRIMGSDYIVEFLGEDKRGTRL